MVIIWINVDDDECARGHCAVCASSLAASCSYLPHLCLFLLMPLPTSVCFLTFVLRPEGLNFIVLELASEEKSNEGLPTRHGIMKQKWTILPLRDKEFLWLDLNCRNKV